MPPLLDSLLQLGPWLTEQGEPAFREGQIRHWLFAGGAGDWFEMTDLPARLREALAEAFPFWSTQIAGHTRSDDGTEKLLLTLTSTKGTAKETGLFSTFQTRPPSPFSAQQVECVLLRGEMQGAVHDRSARETGKPLRSRRTACISTQVGCGMGCVFCASGLDGVERNLSTGEIIEQVLRLQQLLNNGERLSHVVVMGMGEPLANLDALLPALATIKGTGAFPRNGPKGASQKRPSSPLFEGMGISARRITISTVGLPKAMDRLASESPHYRLAISLHAPNDALRNELVPINAKVGGLEAILAAADRYFEASGRRLTFEYVLLGGVNDRPEHARQLSRLLSGRTAMLNVIPYNRVAGLPYQTPSAAAGQAFRRILEASNITVQFRHRKGNRIAAACGQLRRQAVKQPVDSNC